MNMQNRQIWPRWQAIINFFVLSLPLSVIGQEIAPPPPPPIGHLVSKVQFRTSCLGVTCCYLVKGDSLFFIYYVMLSLHTNTYKLQLLLTN